MATYPPPNFTEPVSIWNPVNWEQQSGDGLTIDTAYLNAHYIQYPVAQGAITLQNTQINGNGNFYANLNLVNELYPALTTISQGQYYMSVSSNSSNADGAVMKLTNTTASTGNSVSLGATVAGGLNVNRGISVGCNTTSSGNTILIQADPSTSSQLNVAGNVKISPTQTYPLANSQNLATISYVNGAVGGSSIIGSNNTWTGTNAFNTSTPTTTITQTYPQSSSTTQFSTIGYVNNALTYLFGSNNVWTGTNAFNTSTPTTSITQTYPQASNTTQFSTIGYVNNAINSISVPTSTTYTSSNSATNGWVFSISTAIGNSISYMVYSDVVATNSAKTGLAIPMNYGALVSNQTSFVGTGLGIFQPITGTSTSKVTYCSGSGQNYTIGAGGSGYALSVINCNGNTGMTWTINSNSVGENTANCPPTANGSFSFTYTLNVATNLPTACYAKIIITKIG